MVHLEEWNAKLKHYWAEYNKVQLRLESWNDSEDCDRDGFEEVFHAFSAKIRELISSTLRMSIFSPSYSSVRNSDRGAHVRLP